MQDRVYTDLTGKRFGNRVVQWPVGRHKRHIMWLVLCDCGKFSMVPSNSIMNGGSSSCISCRLVETHKRNPDYKLCYSLEYRMLKSSKCRAKKAGLSFNIEIEDVIIPKVCPLLEIPIIRGTKTIVPNSPTLDRKNSNLGYVKGNVWVISDKANRVKNDASLEEAELLVKNWRLYT